MPGGNVPAAFCGTRPDFALFTFWRARNRRPYDLSFPLTCGPYFPARAKKKIRFAEIAPSASEHEPTA